MQFKVEKPIILASESPRRKELFSMLNVPFRAVTSDVTENVDGMATWDLVEYAKHHALLKAADIAQQHPDSAVIGADTIVGLGSRIFPKPKDAEEAKAFLRELSGQTHAVVTGVAVVLAGEKHVFAVKTDVTFYELDDVLIDSYVASGDPLDKAGAYGIQSGGALFVERIQGDYYTVMGLPIAALSRRLQTLGVLSVKGGV